MVQVAFSSSFKRAKKKRIDPDKKTEQKFWDTLHIFIQNPFDTRLRTHKLSGRLENLWSYSVEFDVRVIFYFSGDHKVVFIDVGTHEEVY